jgi:hypothetical protein
MSSISYLKEVNKGYFFDPKRGKGGKKLRYRYVRNILIKAGTFGNSQPFNLHLFKFTDFQHNWRMAIMDTQTYKVSTGHSVTSNGILLSKLVEANLITKYEADQIKTSSTDLLLASWKKEDETIS